MESKEWLETHYKLLRYHIGSLCSKYEYKINAHERIIGLMDEVSDIPVMNYIEDKATRDELQDVMSNLNILSDFIEFSIDNLKDEDEDEK